MVAVSPVFAAALHSGMRESVMKEINLPDTPAVILEGVLELLYLGSLPSSPNRMVVYTSMAIFQSEFF